MMFTGIIETMGQVAEVISKNSNRSFWIESSISSELRPEQSLCHDGVCLTVEEVQGSKYKVTAIEETLKKTTIATWATGKIVNLERCLRLNDMIDGHIVQGHVDTTAMCLKIKKKNGSHELEFGFRKKFAPLVIEKGSIAVNGISLTAYNVKKKGFTVAVIPYTFEHTNMSTLTEGTEVNIEFDMIGKYLLRRLSLKNL